MTLTQPLSSKHCHLSVTLPDSFSPKADIYINNTTTVTVDINDDIIQAERAVLLAIEIVRNNSKEPLPILRSHLVSMMKLHAKAALEESKIPLGWKLNMRLLTVSLPDKKATAWSNCITCIIKKSTSTFEELDSLIGRLTHISVILQPMKHFLSRI